MPSNARWSAKPVSAIDILVAEDNEVNQIVFTQILQVTGLRFLVVENGQEAVDAWRAASAVASS